MTNIGDYSIEDKVREAEKAVKDGADELDMVMNVKMFLNEHPLKVLYEIKKVASMGAMLKVILETCYLGDRIKEACDLAKKAGAQCVKTSTGYAMLSTTVEHVRAMKKAVRNKLLVKAAGFIKTYDQAVAMIEAGADIIGTSSGVKIYKEAKKLEESQE